MDIYLSCCDVCLPRWPRTQSTAFYCLARPSLKVILSPLNRPGRHHMEVHVMIVGLIMNENWISSCGLVVSGQWVERVLGERSTGQRRESWLGQSSVLSLPVKCSVFIRLNNRLEWSWSWLWLIALTLTCISSYRYSLLVENIKDSTVHTALYTAWWFQTRELRITGHLGKYSNSKSWWRP